MKPSFASIIIASLLLAACAREPTNSDGNGPGNADGLGGRQDPATAPATDLGQPANSQGDAGANVEDSASTPPAQPSQQ